MSSLALGVPLTVVTILGLFLNGYILLVVILSKQMESSHDSVSTLRIHTANNLLLLHLGVVDSLLCCVFLIFSAPSLFRGWTSPCTLHGFLFTLLHPVALWTVCGLNCDRYYAISAPLHYGALVSPKRVAIGIAATWILALILCLPPLFYVAPYRYSPALAGCAPDFAAGNAALWYSAVYSILTLFLPAALILGCNIKVLMIARYHRHRIASAIFEVTLSAQVTITHQRNPFFLPGNVTSKFRGRSPISTVLQLLGSFVLLYFPYYGIILWESSASTFLSGKGLYARAHPHIITLASTLLTCSPPVNGLLYGIKSKILRKSFQNYWRKQMSKCEVNHEIQARTPSACGSRRPSLTPLGILSRPGGSHLQRRLSEVFIEPHKMSQGSSSPQRKMQRISSEIAWRPVSTSGLGLSFAGIDFQGETLQRSKSFRSQHAASFSTLQVPRDQENVRNEELLKSFRVAVASTKSNDDDSGSISLVKPVLGTSISNTNLFVQRVLGSGLRFSLKEKEREGSVQPTRRSPKILITRAYSEESDPKTPSSSNTPVKKDLVRKHSSSAAALIVEKKWIKLKNVSQDLNNDLLNKDLTSFGGSSNSSIEDLDEQKVAFQNGVTTSEDGNNSDGADSIVWMKAIPQEQLVTSSCKSSISESNEYKFDNSVLQSWPTSKRKTYCLQVTDNDSDDEQCTKTQQTQVLRTSCSFTELNSV